MLAPGCGDGRQLLCPECGLRKIQAPWVNGSLSTLTEFQAPYPTSQDPSPAPILPRSLSCHHTADTWVTFLCLEHPMFIPTFAFANLTPWKVLPL